MVTWVFAILTLSFAVFAESLDREVRPSENGAWRQLTFQDRDVDVFIPACVSIFSPMIVSLHAWGSNKETQKTTDRFGTPKYVGEECAVVLYPQGKLRGFLFGAIGFSWNAGGCCPNENKEHVDDVAFISELITHVAWELGITTRNVFVVGVSNGGMLANRIACTDGRVRAIVSVSGPLVNGTSDNQSEAFHCNRVVPILHFHGNADPVVPYDGCSTTTGGKVCQGLQKLGKGSIAPFPAVLEYINEWQIRNGVASDDKGVITFQNGTVSCMSSGRSASNVTLCTIQQEGHAWPGQCTVVNKMPWFRCTLDIDASEHTMAFFRQHVVPVNYHEATPILV